MAKRWKVATVALAVVKGKKKSQSAQAKKDKNKKQVKKKQPSSSEYSSGSSEGSYYSSSEEEDSSSQSSGSSDDNGNKNQSSSSANKPKVTPSFSSNGGGGNNDASDSDSDDSSFGCGVYHRRESMSEASSSSSSSESSSSYYSSDDSSQSSRSGSQSGSKSKSGSGDDDSSKSSNKSQSTLESGSKPVVSSPPDPGSDSDSSSSSASVERPNTNKFRGKQSKSNNNAVVEEEDNSSVRSSNKPKLKSLVKALSSKKNSAKSINADSDDDGGESVASYNSKFSHKSNASKVSHKSNASKVSNKSKASKKATNKSNKASSKGSGNAPPNKNNTSTNNVGTTNNKSSLTPSMFDDEQASMMQRRRPDGGGRGGKGRGGGRGGKSSRKLTKNTGGRGSSSSGRKLTATARNNEKKTEAAKKDVEDTFSDLLSKVRNQKMENDTNGNGGDSGGGGGGGGGGQNKKQEEVAEDKFSNLLERVRTTKNTTSDNKSSNSDDKLLELSDNVSSDEAPARKTGKEGSELSYSLKKELLANANSNLRSSATSIKSEEGSANDQSSSQQQRDYHDASKKSAGSSRFASMMANLKSSNEPIAERKSSMDYDIMEDDEDDEHIFEAPKIVDQRGQPTRRSSTYKKKSSTASVRSDDSSVEETAEEGDDGGEDGKRSRFFVRRPSLKQLITRGNSDKSLGKDQDKEKDDDDDDDDDGREGSSNYHSDEDSNISEASISTASSGEDGNSGSVMNVARMRYPEDEEILSEDDDDLDYYDGEPAMTILTPITEMDSIASDVESHFSDGSESDVEGDFSPDHNRQFNNSNVVKAKEPGRRSSGKAKGPTDMVQVIKRVRANDPDFREINLDDNRLNDFDAAKLFYLLHENTQVTQISFANNKLGDGSAVSLAQVLVASETITHVCLRRNNIGNKGALALKKALKLNETLIHLDLNDNDIDSYVLEGLQKSSSAVIASDPPTPSSAHVEQNTRAVGDEIMMDLAGSGKIHTSENDQRLSSLKQSECSTLNEPLSSDVSYSERTSSGSEEEEEEEGASNCTEDLISISSEGKDEETSSPSSVMKIFDKACSSRSKDTRSRFQGAFSTAQQSNAKTQDEIALLLAMSMALPSLDSEWCLKTSSSTTRRTLGVRDRLLPFNNFDKIEKHRTLNETHDKRKVSPSLRKMTHSRWKKSMSSVSSLRSSLLSLSELNIDEDPLGVSTHSSNGNNSSFNNQRELSKPTLPNVQSKQHLWASSLKKLDPRWQIRKFFNDMSLFGTLLGDVSQSDNNSEGTAIFSVWRPTSADAIAKMMRGDGVGKGLEIKGKSAKKGELSGYIPFLQIHEQEHKSQIRMIPKGDRTKIFFRSRKARDRVGQYLGTIAKEFTLRIAKAKFGLAKAKLGHDANRILTHELEYASKMLPYEVDNPKVVQNDNYAPEMYCIEVSVRILWEGLVIRKDISRSPGSKFETGRASQPAFQDMNFAALRRRVKNEPLPVLFQNSEDDPFDSRMLVMAYEEEGKIVPVVSDFDCFLIGSRNFSYDDPMSLEQVELLDWCVSQIEWILDNHTEPDSWTTRWLEILKYAARNKFYPSMPRFGFGDPTSYSMIEASVKRSAKTCGAVRHGPECFNFFFPQELDEEFLIIFPGSQLWRYVNEKELISMLRQKIKEGFTFPLNPKWLLCDPGWISLFQDLLNSKHASVQKSIDLWFPPDSGLRERILDISKRFPNGFLRDDQVQVSSSLAQQEYERYLILQRARGKMRGFIFWRNLLMDVRQRATENNDDASADNNCRSIVEEFKFLDDKKKRKLSINSDDVEVETLKEINNLDFFGANDEDSYDSREP